MYSFFEPGKKRDIATVRMTGGMDRWMKDNRQHKHGVHRYSLEQFGPSAEQVEARFADYIARYDVATSR